MRTYKEVIIDPPSFLTQRNTDLSNVVESGSNENGDWVRYVDGTQICWFRTTATNIAISTTYGSLFSGSRLWTFPQSFTDNPVVTCSQFRWGTGASWGGVGSVTMANTQLVGLDSISRASGTNVHIAAMAIGRWR